MIENVPSADVARLKTDNRVEVTSALSNRLIYLHMDRFREETPFIKAKDGSAIKNPFNNLKVRQALSMALNRQAIVDRIMEGEAVVAAQLLPDIYQGTSKTLKPTAYSVDGARKLLAEAGLPNGFSLTIHGPNGRYPNDTKVIEPCADVHPASASRTKVETLPPAVFLLARLQWWPEPDAGILDDPCGLERRHGRGLGKPWSASWHLRYPGGNRHGKSWPLFEPEGR